MTDTFEEIAAREIDGLYQGAMFLSGGDAQAAEDLLLATLATAFHEFQRSGGAENRSGGVENAGRWLEERLVQEFVGSVPAHLLGASPGTEPEFRLVRSGHAGPFSTIDPHALYRASQVVSPEARAALWLVIFRRWTYADTAELLGLTPGELRDLLRYRHALVAAVVGRGGAKNGTDGAVN